MPDSEVEVTREELHFRRIDMRGYKRSDDLFEVVGRVTDRKSYDFVPWRGGKEVPAGQPMHDMGVRLVFDESLRVKAVETFTEAHPYPVCPEGGHALQALVGLRMASGWNKEVRSRLAGAASCTHLMELLGPMATIAYQTLSQVNRNKPDRADANGRPLKIDSCYAYAADGDLVRVHWPEFYRRVDQDDRAAGG